MHALGGKLRKKKKHEYFDKIFDQVDIVLHKIWKWVLASAAHILKLERYRED